MVGGLVFPKFTKFGLLSDKLGRHVEKIFDRYYHLKSGTLKTGLQNLSCRPPG